MAEAVFDEKRRRVTVGPWSARAAWIGEVSDGRWSAMLGIRHRVNLVVRGAQRADMVWIELWAGEPELSDGLAVVVGAESLVGVARIPLCSCGERACGNAGTQLATEMPAERLPILVETIRQLPDVAGDPRDRDTWSGVFVGDTPSVY